jgi:hypothetical protein
MSRFSVVIFAVVFGLASYARGAETLCDVLANPAAHDQKVIEVTAFASRGFENFTFLDPRCTSEFPQVWLEYGGTFASGTIYCCGVGPERRRSKALVVENVVTGIVSDRLLRQFDQLLEQRPDSVVHATIRGHFFAANRTEGTFGGGYGHFGMFDLLVIEQVLSVDPHDLRHVEYRLWADRPAINETGCFVKSLSGFAYTNAIEQQRQAQAGIRSWAFTEPKRVAAEHLRAAVSGKAIQLRRLRKRPGTEIYEGTVDGSDSRYWVVVSRPYWLTFFAEERNHIAWVAVGADETNCDNHRNAR